jgi:LAO/AO transport system kinase
MRRCSLQLDALLSALKGGDRGALARSITLSDLRSERVNCWANHLFSLAESQLPEHRQLAQELLSRLPSSENTFRIGISGSPGVGKSTLIEKLGLHCISLGHRVATLVR